MWLEVTAGVDNFGHSSRSHVVHWSLQMSRALVRLSSQHAGGDYSNSLQQGMATGISEDLSSVLCPDKTNKSMQVKPIRAIPTAVVLYFCLFETWLQKAHCLLVLYHNWTHRYILTSGQKVICWPQLQPNGANIGATTEAASAESHM